MLLWDDTRPLYDLRAVRTREGATRGGCDSACARSSHYSAAKGVPDWLASSVGKLELWVGDECDLDAVNQLMRIDQGREANRPSFNLTPLACDPAVMSAFVDWFAADLSRVRHNGLWIMRKPSPVRS